MSSGSPYSTLFSYLIESGECSAFALVDGLQYERHFGDELKLVPGSVMPFFDVWPDSRIAFAGPWLIDLSKAMHLHPRLRELEDNLPAVSWLAARSTPRALINHLKPFLHVALPDGNAGLLRFWDPRVAARLPQILEGHQLGQLLKGIRDWLFTVDGRLHSLKWRER